MPRFSELHILAERPNVPATWLIFNAPRPIYGHQTWTGNFKCGIFYAAVDPDGEYAQDYIAENARLDAELCRYITHNEVRDWAEGMCTMAGDDIETFTEEELRVAYFSMAQPTTVTL